MTYLEATAAVVGCAAVAALIWLAGRYLRYAHVLGCIREGIARVRGALQSARRIARNTREEAPHPQFDVTYFDREGNLMHGTAVIEQPDIIRWDGVEVVLSAEPEEEE